MARALLVEDDKLFREAVADLLVSQFPGIAVDQATDSASALQRLNAQRPDLAFVDIGLPGRNGILLTRDIKAIDAKVYVVMLTSHDLPEYREAAFREGADWYICKMADQCRDEIIDRVARFGLRASRRRTG